MKPEYLLIMPIVILVFVLIYLDHWLCAIGSDNDEIDSDNTFELVYEF